MLVGGVVNFNFVHFEFKCMIDTTKLRRINQTSPVMSVRYSCHEQPLTHVWLLDMIEQLQSHLHAHCHPGVLEPVGKSQTKTVAVGIRHGNGGTVRKAQNQSNQFQMLLIIIRRLE